MRRHKLSHPTYDGRHNMGIAVTNESHYGVSHNASGHILVQVHDGADEARGTFTIEEAETLIKLLFENVVKARIEKEKKCGH